jgi:MFS family permease
MSEAQSATNQDGLDPAAVAPQAAAAPRPQISVMGWYTLAVLTLISLFCYMDRIAVSILMEAIKHDLHLSDRQLGLLSGLAFALFYSTLGLPLAWLADRTPRVRLISVCLAIWSAMTALSGVARSFPQLFLARMGVGIGEAGCVPPAHSIIGDYFPRERRALAVSIFQAGGSLGISGGLILIGMLGQQLGWRTSLQIVGLAGVPLAILAFFTVREPPRPKPPADMAKESLFQALGVLLRRPALVHLALAYSIAGVCTLGFAQWSPTYLIRSFGLNMASAGAWTGVTSAVSGVLGLLFGGTIATWLTKRDARWEIWLPGIACATSLPFFAAVMLTPTLGIVQVLKVFLTFVASVGNGVSLSAAQSFAEPHRRALAVSLMFFLFSLLGQGLGPYVVGWVSDLLTPSLGKESLRYALLVSCAALPWAVTHYYLAARASVKDRLN